MTNARHLAGLLVALTGVAIASVCIGLALGVGWLYVSGQL